MQEVATRNTFRWTFRYETTRGADSRLPQLAIEDLARQVDRRIVECLVHEITNGRSERLESLSPRMVPFADRRMKHGRMDSQLPQVNGHKGNLGHRSGAREEPSCCG